MLGSGEFVERLLKEADGHLKYQFPEKERGAAVKKLVMEECKKDGVDIKELTAGSRRQPVSRLRFRIAVKLFEKHSIPMAKIARNTGVSTSAVSKMIST